MSDDAHPEHDTNERAERAILSAAEAYRLVEEARQMREERDAANARIASHRGFVKEHMALRRWATAVEADRDALTEAGNALAHALDLLASRAKFAVDALAAWRRLVPR